MSNRSLSVILFSDFFRKSFEWDLKTWRKDMQYLDGGSESLEIWSQYSQLNNILSSIFDATLSRVLVEQTMDYYYFFDQFSEHIEKHKDEKIRVKEHDRMYAEHLLSNFYRTFLDKAADSPNNFHLWEFFPKNWRVTTEALTDSKNLLPRITLGEFLQWANGRISRGKDKDFDRALDDASENLFPEVDPVRWAALLTFVLTPYDPQNRVGYVIKRPWIFGLGGRMRSFSGPAGDDKKFEEDMQKHMRAMDEVERDKTFELVLALSKIVGVFYQTFTKENLKKFISETESLGGQYATDSIEEHRRIRFLEIFSDLLKFMENKEQLPQK